MEVMHVYGQLAWHDEVIIAATRDRLIALRQAITEALDSNHLGGCTAFANDGEGYMVAVCVLSEEQMNQLPVPYTDEFAKPDASGAILTPYTIPGIVPFLTALQEKWTQEVTKEVE